MRTFRFLQAASQKGSLQFIYLLFRFVFQIINLKPECSLFQDGQDFPNIYYRTKKRIGYGSCGAMPYSTYHFLGRMPE